MINFGSKTKNKIINPEKDLYIFGTKKIYAFDYKKSEHIKFLPPGMAGNIYDVILFKIDTKKIFDVEHFQSVLLHPPMYINAVQENKYCGVIGKSYVESFAIFEYLLELIIDPENFYEPIKRICEDFLDLEGDINA